MTETSRIVRDRHRIPILVATLTLGALATAHSQEPLDGPFDECGAIRTWNFLGAYDNPGGETPGEEAIRADYMTDGETGELDFEWRPGATIETDYSRAASSRIYGGSRGRNPGGVPTVFPYREETGSVGFQTDAGFGEDLNLVMAYAQVYVIAERRMEVFLGIASDDSIQVILESQGEIWIHNVGRGARDPCDALFPSDEFPVTLAPGYNSLIVKVFEGSGDWRFVLRFQDEFGDPITEGLATSLEPDPSPPRDDFLRGDADGDGSVNISDAVFTLHYLFVDSARSPTCQDAADADDTGRLNLTDAVFLLRFFFLEGLRPPDPFGDCGTDPTADSLTCATPSSGC
jgi:hypothetical protein